MMAAFYLGPRAVGGLVEMSRIHPLKKAMFKNKWQQYAYCCAKWQWNANTYPKLGLYLDDLISEEDDIMREALRRLPDHVMQARNYRLARAQLLNIQHEYLPKDQWIQFDQNSNNRYLWPLLIEVRKEWDEQDAWIKGRTPGWWLPEPLKKRHLEFVYTNHSRAHRYWFNHHWFIVPGTVLMELLILYFLYRLIILDSIEEL